MNEGNKKTDDSQDTTRGFYQKKIVYAIVLIAVIVLAVVLIAKFVFNVDLISSTADFATFLRRLR
jgi:t-SNARE complex subunit (syntaxin)